MTLKETQISRDTERSRAAFQKVRAKKDLEKLNQTVNKIKKSYDNKRIQKGRKNPTLNNKVKSKKMKKKRNMDKCAQELNEIMEEPDTPTLVTP